MPSRIFLTSLELGIFEELGDKQVSASEMAARLNSDARATEVLLNALAALNLVAKNGNLFANEKGVAGLLLKEGADTGDAMLRHAANLWENWSHLTDTVRSGKPPRVGGGTERRTALALATKEQGRNYSQRLAWALNCHGAERMLDLGGGCGLHALTFAVTYPRLQVVLFDREEEALRMARAEIAGKEVEARVSIRKGDFLTDDIGSDFDLVLLSFVLSLLGEDQIPLLLKKVEGSLRPGGRVVVLDMILENDKTHPAPAALFSVNMLVTTGKGRAYSFREIEDFLLASGLRTTYRVPIGHFQGIVGTR
jgi:ubiquinone/menaquinone biosynthesis C-methylase UbiE